MSECEVCSGIDFLNVEAVKFVKGDDDFYIRPDVFCFHAIYCPKCGRFLNESSAEEGGNVGR